MSADKRQFIDTNILVYAYDLSAGTKQRRARELMSGLWESDLGCLSIQILQEFFVNITRKIPLPLPADDARAIVADLAEWRLHSPTAADVLAAITLARDHQLSFWDAAILISAQRLDCEVLWSEDLPNDACYGGIKVMNPFKQSETIQEPIAPYTTAPAGQGGRTGGK